MSHPIASAKADISTVALLQEQAHAGVAAPARRKPRLFQATFYKEWIKLRLYWVLLFSGSLVFAAFLSLRLRSVHQFHDAVSIWGAWIFKSYLFFEPYEYVPAGAGVVLGALQFLLETLNKRVRLVLHLPMNEERVISHHLLAGLLLLTLIFLPATAIFTATGWMYFPVEFQQNLALTLSPWLLAGYASYLLTASVLLETSWRHRVFYLLLGGGALSLFYLGDFYDVYKRVLPVMAGWVAALFVLPLFSSHRFRKGIDS
jgi:hypothetical protein